MRRVAGSCKYLDLCMPREGFGVRGRDDLVGVINVRTNPPHEYTEVHVRLLDSIARQVGGAVENYNQYRRMEQRASQLSTLSEISRTITSDMYLEEILQLIVAMTAESMNFKICSIMLLDKDKKELSIKATQSKSRSYTKKPNLKLSESVAGRAIVEKAPVTIRDVRQAPEYQFPDVAKKEGLCSLVALPLSVKNEMIGVLNCYTGAPHEFSDEEISLLTALATFFEKKKSGFIVGISSVAGDRGRQSNYVYGSAKGAFALFLQGLRNRLHPAGVRVLTVKPGFIDTRMTFGEVAPGMAADPEAVGAAILKALDRNRSVIYVPWFWRYIMLVIRSIPEPIFKRLRL